ncbi:GNAT family N-acetyltransferase [Agrobacterium sp.]|jgi:ribosomal protein S18 acetylase RimI-like enzyme|uniref:GNAT family N-acetyltransferase n=1 Tax=Agrobacterium sp. TaxID=361 RepID=UPI0028B0F63A|nr:GNAT family N-acetyltransferase [Agrobacterium sp.]
MTVVRRARSTDVDAIFEIRTSVTQNHLSHQQLLERGISPEVVSEALESETCGWIAEVDGQAAAFAMVDFEDASVFALFVKPSFEGKGLGNLLMDEAEGALFATHETIWLETDASPDIRANGFYQRRNWVAVGTDDKGDVRYEKKRG